MTAIVALITLLILIGVRHDFFSKIVDESPAIATALPGDAIVDPGISPSYRSTVAVRVGLAFHSDTVFSRQR